MNEQWRGGTRDTTVVTGVKGCSEQGNVSLLSKPDKVVCSSLELVQTQALKTLPSCTIDLVLSNNRKSVHILKGPP